jgi:hypothetical protein
MPFQTCQGALMLCSFGMTPSPLLPSSKGVLTTGAMAANVMDHVPIANIPSFGMCRSLANPSVASATSAALGVLTPMPCIPITPVPWVTGSPTVTLCGSSALNDTSVLACAWGGAIAFVSPGQSTHLIP